MFRTLGKSKIAFVLAIIFGISLFFFKSSSRYSNFFNSDSVIAKVSETKISTSKFNRVMQMNINKFNQMLGKKMTGDEIRSFQIPNLALQALINDAVFENEFDNLNFKIDEKVIALKTKEKIPQLYDSNNNLNELYLNTFLQQQQLKIEDVVQIVNYETRDEFFTNAMFDLNYPIYFSNKINNFDSHQRKITYLKIELEKISTKNILDEYSVNLDSELQDFYNDNINLYLSEEKRDLEYILLDKDILHRNTVVDSYEIKEYYNNNKKLFLKNEKRSFLQFNFKKEKDAKDFIEIINNFNLSKIIEYAKNNNIQYSDFEELKANEILNQISKPLFDLKLNEKSKIIKTSLANHVLILKSITPSYQLNFDQAKDNIKNTIKKIQTNNKFNDLINDISEGIINGSSIDEISNFHKLNINSLINISRNFNDFDQSKEVIFSNLLESSFKANKDFVSNIIKINENLSFIYNVSNIEKSIPKDFNNIKETILKDWERIKIIEKTKENVENNKNNNMFIKDLSIKYDQIPIKTIVSNINNELPPNVLSKIFNSNININIHELHENTFYIINIDDITIPKNEFNKEVISLNKDLRNSFGNEIMKNKKISTNENLINAIIEQY